MRLQVEFVGLPDLRKAVGGRQIQLELPGTQSTLGEVVAQLAARYGEVVRTSMLDSNGMVDLSIQVIRNGTEWLSREEMDRCVKDGDRVTFLLMVAGG
ncbi:MAG: MoaD/ThiS family protein [Thermodesulfobacteriota bacterium]